MEFYRVVVGKILKFESNFLKFLELAFQGLISNFTNPVQSHFHEHLIINNYKLT